ncbi:MAG: hypothetical protein J6U00_02455 [Ruminococcus sp.]|uniref:hypothetical protein n=1 Tax=Ruminococcus sp. TaxID=41978 RepID=UPI001B246685|nr:hypothetical protein [Ruminococcus sp.]MBO7472858.1 hypothetical protein [Ruminococcus sp.]
MKKLIAAALLTAMLASLASCGKNAKAADTEYIYGKIDSISGNDIVLLLADYNEEAESSDAKDKDDKDSSDDENTDSKSERTRPSRSDGGEGSRSFKMPEDGEMPEGFDPEQFSGKMPGGFSRSEDGEISGSFKKPENGEMPEGFDPEQFIGKMPGGFSRSEDGEISGSFKKPENGEMPEGFDPENFSGEIPEGFSKLGDGEKSKGFSRSKTRENSGSSKYTLTGEQEELRIPVGTTVTTSLGVKTDFDVLSAGDIIKCSIEKDTEGNDVVTEVWIMEK